MEPILNSQLPEFSVQAFHNGSFKTASGNGCRSVFRKLRFALCT